MAKQSSDRRHRLSGTHYAFALDAATAGTVEVCCERCGQRQPNATAEDERNGPDRAFVGCLRCGHPLGRYR